MDEFEDQKDTNAEEIKAQFGRRLRELRTAKGVSQLDLGVECGLSQTYLSEVEAGKRNISLVNMHKLAKALSVTLATIVEGVE